MTTFDTGAVEHGTLSGGDLTFTHDGTSNDGGAPSSTSKVVASLGKWYAEFHCNAGSGSDLAIGVCAPGTSAHDFGFNVTNSVALYTSNNVWKNGSNQGLSGNATAFGIAKTFAILLDLDNNRVRFDNVTDGQTGTYFSLPTETAFVLRANDNSGTGVLVLKATASFAGIVPAGFTGWDDTPDSSSEPFASSSEPFASSSEPFASSSEPGASSSEPSSSMDSSSEPGASSSEVDSSGESPVRPPVQMVVCTFGA